LDGLLKESDIERRRINETSASALNGAATATGMGQ
jgi:hypothetical protein